MREGFLDDLKSEESISFKPSSRGEKRNIQVFLSLNSTSMPRTVRKSENNLKFHENKLQKWRFIYLFIYLVLFIPAWLELDGLRAVSILMGS